MGHHIILVMKVLEIVINALILKHAMIAQMEKKLYIKNKISVMKTVF